MKNLTIKLLRGCLHGVLPVFLALGLWSCGSSEPEVGDEPFDASKEVTITEFFPRSGGVYQRMVIYGENFGNDTSLVHVSIGGKKAILINVNPKTIYCFVPSGAFSGEIEVSVGNDSTGVRTGVAAEKFKYERKMVLSTLMGRRSAYGDEG